MKKRMIAAIAIVMISGSVALAQSTASKAKAIPVVTDAAPSSVDSKRANAKVNRKTSDVESTKLPERDRGAQHEKLDSNAREQTMYDPGMKPRNKSDKMRMGQLKGSK